MSYYFLRAYSNASHLDSVLSLLSERVIWAQPEKVHATVTLVTVEQDALGCELFISKSPNPICSLRVP